MLFEFNSEARFNHFLLKLTQWMQAHPNHPIQWSPINNPPQKNGKVDLSEFYDYYDTPQNTFIYSDEGNEFYGIVGQSFQVNNLVRTLIKQSGGSLYNRSSDSASSAAGMPFGGRKHTYEFRSNNLERQIQREKKGKGIGKYFYQKLATKLFKPSGWTTPQINVPYPANMPPKSDIIQFANAAYEPASQAPTNISGWQLFKSTDTIKFYKKPDDDSVIIVAIRGSADMSDVYADLQIATVGVKTSARYQKDLVTMQQVKQQYPNATYYGVGHSLGGALADQFIADGYIKTAVCYNPAVEKKYLSSPLNYRIYMENDPLFNTMGKYSRIGEVRPQPPVSKLDTIASAQSLAAHKLSNFVGGRRIYV